MEGGCAAAASPTDRSEADEGPHGENIGMIPELLEGDGMLGERIQSAHRVRGIQEPENLHSILADPVLPDPLSETYRC